MKIRFKLFATLSEYLPQDAKRNEVDIEVAEGATPADLIAAYRLPPRLTHLVLVNGVYIPPEQRASRSLQDGDSLAIWPPIAGG